MDLVSFWLLPHIKCTRLFTLFRRLDFMAEFVFVLKCEMV